MNNCYEEDLQLQSDKEFRESKSLHKRKMKLKEAKRIINAFVSLI